jgi:acyl-CoA reductase-like NAD-dependent aldehyde dehydrogenase
MRDIFSYIDGRFVQGKGESFYDHNPSNGQAHAKVHPIDTSQVGSAIDAARRTLPEWRNNSCEARAAWLNDIADVIEERNTELAALETADTGMLLSLTAQGHIPRAVECFRYFAAAIDRGETCYPLQDAYLTLVRRESLGVLGIIAPWNAPFVVAAMNVAAALAVGNCVILKPSERSPLTSFLLAEIADNLDLPPGVLQVVQGGAEIGRELASAEGIDGLCFVGGVDAGREIIRSSANNFKRLTLELGGKSPTIIFADANFDSALDGALLSAFAGNGEVCAAGSRILVERKIYPAFLEALSARTANICVGDPMLANSEMGPLIDSDHRSRVDAMVHGALGEGARATTPIGVPADLADGSYYAPVVLDRVNPGMRIAQEEVFGPVAAVMPFDSEAEAMAIADDTVFGLHASIWTADLPRALRIASNLSAGSVAINAGMVRDIRVPIGGRKRSGLGRLGGRWSLDAFSEPKSIAISINPYALPRLGSNSETR